MNEVDIRRRLLLGSAVGGFALGLPRTGEADTAFTNFSFAASGAPTARTMPDRLGDIINVKDWGAKGDGHSDDNPAIQAAIQQAIKQGGGTVFFPPGSYMLGNPGYLTCGSPNDIGVQFIGSGKDCTFINGSGSVLSKGVGNTFDNIERVEGISPRGTIGIVATRANFSLADSRPGGAPAVDVSGALGAMVTSCEFSGAVNMPNTATPGATPGTVALYLGSGGTAVNCRVQGGYDVGFALSGQGAACIGCATEVCNTGVRVGWGPGGEAVAQGCTVQAFQTERTWYGIDLYNCEGCYISGCIPTCSAGTPGPYFGPISHLSWNAGTVTVNTLGDHHIPMEANILQFTNLPNNPNYLPNSQALFAIAVNVTGNQTFTYALTPNPGAFNNADAGAEFWNYPGRYALRCRALKETVISGINSGSFFASLATVDLDYGGASRFRNVVFISLDSPNGWILPKDKSKLAGCRFINVGDSVITNWPPGGIPNPYGRMSFANLPPVPMEGQEFDIVDSPTTTFAADASPGGGGNHVKVRWDAASATWKVTG
jgi:hypothetical protein